MKQIAAIIPLCMVCIFACSSSHQVATAVKADDKKKTEEKSAVKDRIAVLDLKSDGIAQSKTRMISELIRTELISTNKYVVIERSQIDMLLKEHGFSTTGITDESSAVKVGKILSAQKILIGTVMKLGESMIITSRIVDVEKGIAEFGAKVSTQEDGILEGVASLVAQLTGGVADAAAETKTSSASLKTSKNKYKVNEDIIVTFKNFPGTKYDYISIAKENASAKGHDTYKYTSGDKQGSITFYSGVRYPGEYEVRAHTEYSKGNYEYQAKVRIKIVE